MTTLRDEFDKTFDKGGFTYVQWSQVADRLDEAGEGWSFNIVALGPDWCHGRLTIGPREFDNIGYAENADADWKHEPLKDAVSDAFKRCAALAGVARYLYDKDQPRTPSRAPAGRTPSSTPRPAAPSSGPEFAPNDWDEPTPIRSSGSDNSDCPIHNVQWNGEWGDLWHKTEDGAYCRHPDNTRQPGRQKAGSRR